MLLKARRWRDSPFFPQVKFSTPTQFLTEAISHGLPTTNANTTQTLLLHQVLDKLPLWKDELYLELHRGCYTSHGDQKQQNRRGEDLLYQAEVWATVAQLATGQPYPKEKLEVAWKGLLFNQFHDILPGSSIPEVFEDANREWGKIDALGQEVLETALATLAAQTVTDQGQPLLVFNSHSWSRSEVVDVVVPPGNWQIVNCETHHPVDCVVNVLRHPLREDGPQEDQVLSFLARDVPAVGYRLYALVADESLGAVKTSEEKANFILENAYLRVFLEPETGEIVSCLHLETGQEMCNAVANQLQCFEDSGQYWDAWNIAPDYADKPLPPSKLVQIEWIDRSSIRQRLRVTRQLHHSTIVQDYVLDAESPLLKVETWVDWQETQVVLKVNFPVTVGADSATYEVPFGAIERPTKPTTDSEKAKWEVPALRWADLSSDAFGLSILTDCKHGFDAQQCQLRLTLLKAPVWPDPGCDRGYHHFTYAIYPHAGNWQMARTPHHAQALNIPLRTYTPEISQSIAHRHTHRSFLHLDSDHLLLSAFKPSDIDQSSFIARYYDAYGIPDKQPAPPIVNTLGLGIGEALNVLEEPIDDSLPNRPYQIHTRRLLPDP
jgi:alpha-mannosidase